MSVFKHVEIPPDPTLILNKLYLEDTNEKKINLGVGAYRDDDGKPWILPSVQQAHKVITDQSSMYNHEYPPQGGFKDFLDVSRNFLLGEGNQVIKENRIASCQSLSGTGSLYILFEFIHATLPNSDLHIPATTWANHFGIYTHVYNKAPCKYPYFDAKTGTLDYENFINYLKNLKDGEIILLQAVAQNPSGVDPSREQWEGILKVMQQKKHIALFDNAYQGFATGSFEDDGFAIKLFAEAGLECMVAQSFAKNFGLYGERVGCAHVIHNRKGDAEFTTNIQQQLAKLVRVSWSLSPVYGANIIRVIGGNKEFYQQFLKDVKTMADRIKNMRELLYAKLKELNAKGNWEVIKTNIGMFSLTPLTKKQVLYLREKHHVYLVDNGRMSMSGVNSKNVETVAKAFVDAINSVSE